MILLTEEQIDEITDLIGLNSQIRNRFKSELIRWNEKKTGIQVNIDWSQAPDSVVSASIGLTWVNEDGLYSLGYNLTKIDRLEPLTIRKNQSVDDSNDSVVKDYLTVETVKNDLTRLDGAITFAETKHYDFMFNGVKIDPYRIFEIYGITNPALQHVIKKLLRCGKSVKSFDQDIDEAIASLMRLKEMRSEDREIGINHE